MACERQEEEGRQVGSRLTGTAQNWGTSLEEVSREEKEKRGGISWKKRLPTEHCELRILETLIA